MGIVTDFATSAGKTGQYRAETGFPWRGKGAHWALTVPVRPREIVNELI
jgi:hypothetical protein